MELLGPLQVFAQLLLGFLGLQLMLLFLVLIDPGDLVFDDQVRIKDTTSLQFVKDGLLREQVVGEQVDKLSRFDVEDTKITATKKAILRSFEMRADTNRKILNLISSINYLNLDLNYFENYKNNLKQVNKDSIKAALNRAMDFDNVSVFTVGKSIE